MEQNAIAKTQDPINTNEIVSIIKEAPDVLTKNRESLKKATDRGHLLIETAEKNGMSNDLSNLMSDFLVKLKRTKSSVLEKRKPFTQVMDSLKKEFTEIESSLSEKSDIYIKIKSMMDSYARELYIKQEQERKEKEKILNKEKEVFDIVKSVHEFYNNVLSNHIFNNKTAINKMLSEVTLETIDNVEFEINKFPAIYSRLFFDSIKLTPAKFFYHTEEEVLKIAKTVNLEEIYNDHSKLHEEEIGVCKINTIHQIGSKKNELIELKNANEKEKEKILQQQKQRELEEAEKSKQDAEKLMAQKSLEVETKTVGKQAQAQILFGAELSENKVEVKKEYQIKILSKAGYMELFKFWFDKEANNLSDDKIKKMTIERMIAYAEKKAESEKIKSEFLQYKEIIKSK
jgi:hypothetical protein